MHKLSDTLKLMWCFAKWARIGSQQLKRLSQFSLLKWEDIKFMTTSFKKKIDVLQNKNFPSFFQTNVNNISKSFIFMMILLNFIILKDKMKQTIQWVKADKVSDISEISNKVLQTRLIELILILTDLFNTCVIHEYYSKQFRKAQIIVLHKLKKSNYIDSKTYKLIVLLSWNSSHVFTCSNKSKMQTIHDLSTKSVDWSSACSLKL